MHCSIMGSSHHHGDEGPIITKSIGGTGRTAGVAVKGDSLLRDACCICNNDVRGANGFVRFGFK